MDSQMKKKEKKKKQLKKLFSRETVSLTIALGEPAGFQCISQHAMKQFATLLPRKFSHVLRWGAMHLIPASG